VKENPNLKIFAKIFLIFPNIGFPKLRLLSYFPCNARTLAPPVGRILCLTCFTLLIHSDFLLAISIKKKHLSQLQMRITWRYRLYRHSVSESKRGLNYRDVLRSCSRLFSYSIICW